MQSSATATSFIVYIDGGGKGETENFQRFLFIINVYPKWQNCKVHHGLKRKSKHTVVMRLMNFTKIHERIE